MRASTVEQRPDVGLRRNASRIPPDTRAGPPPTPAARLPAERGATAAVTPEHAEGEASSTASRRHTTGLRRVRSERLGLAPGIAAQALPNPVPVHHDGHSHSSVDGPCEKVRRPYLGKPVPSVRENTLASGCGARSNPPRDVGAPCPFGTRSARGLATRGSNQARGFAQAPVGGSGSSAPSPLWTPWDPMTNPSSTRRRSSVSHRTSALEPPPSIVSKRASRTCHGTKKLAGSRVAKYSMARRCPGSIVEGDRRGDLVFFPERRARPRRRAHQRVVAAQELHLPHNISSGSTCG